MWQIAEGSPNPLGVHGAGERLNFAVYSKNARAMELVLYERDNWVTPALRIALDPYKNKTERVWHCTLPAADAARYAYYAYVADGPSLAECIRQGLPRDAWDAFDPSKILLDPYARTVFIPPGFDPKAAAQPGTSTAGVTYLGVLPAADDARRNHRRANRHGSDLIIYEMHVRGFTKSPTCPVREDLRGTYAGALFGRSGVHGGPTAASPVSWSLVADALSVPRCSIGSRQLESKGVP